MAQDRIALLIGNQAYQAGVGALENPINDITLVGKALERIGFEVLEPVTNGSRADILLRVNDFAAELDEAGDDAIGFLYYSGHGIAVSGENYILPVDITRPTNRQLRVNGVRLTEILETLRTDAPKAAHYLVFDACRTNLRGRRGGKGFLPVAEESGALIAFAAQPGETASDFGDGSGPYATALAAELVKPGHHDLDMFHNVRIKVSRTTQGEQIPWTSDGILRPERPYFAGREHSLPEADIREAQRLLSELGFDPGEVDGKIRPKAVSAVKEFQSRHGLIPTGQLSGDLLALLRATSNRQQTVQPDIIFRLDKGGKRIFDAFFGLGMEPPWGGVHYPVCAGEDIVILNDSKNAMTLEWVVLASEPLGVVSTVRDGHTYTFKVPQDLSSYSADNPAIYGLRDRRSYRLFTLDINDCDKASELRECMRYSEINNHKNIDDCRKEVYTPEPNQN